MTTGPVYGLDICKEMIDMANVKKETDKHDIEYIVQDVSAPFKLPMQFDIAALTWLLAHSNSYEMITRIMKNVYDNLKPGGRAVSIGIIGQPMDKMRELEKYGFYKFTYPDGITELVDGTPGKVQILAPGLDIVLDDYWFSQEAFHKALVEVGFVNIEWAPLTLSPEWRGDKHFWDKFIENNAHGFFSAYKPE